MNYEDLVLKTYELSLDPEKIQDFMDAWNEKSHEDMVGLEDHLEKASRVMDLLNLRANPYPKDFIVKPGVEAVANYLGDIVQKSDGWDRLFPNCENLYDALPEWHQQEMQETLFEVKSQTVATARLMVCRSQSGTAESFVLVWRTDADEVDLAKGFHIRWLKMAEWRPRLDNYFMVHHGLSHAEMTVLKYIVAGFSFSQIAKKTDKSGETIKTQSKAIYSKLGVSNREDVVRFALHLRFLLPERQEESLGPTSAIKRIVLEIKGRQLHVLRKGKLTGMPFLFLHGMVSGYELGRPFENALVANDLCAFCIERPGYGQSDDPESVDTIIEEWLDKFPHILAALGLEHVTLVSHASGVGYVAATLERYPDLAPRGLGISSGIPHDKGNKKHPLSYRFLHWCLNRSEKALRFNLRAQAIYLNSEERLKKMIFSNYAACAIDREAIENEEILRCLMAGYKLCRRPRMNGLIGDLKAMWTGAQRWDSLLRTAKPSVRFHHIWGTEDPMISLENYKAYCARSDLTSFSLIKGGGHLLQHTHSQEVVGRIRAMVMNELDWTRDA